MMNAPTHLTPEAEDQLRDRLRAAGLRATRGRIVVLAHLQAATAPISHGDLATHLTPEGFDRASIYRNLMDLTRVGLVRRTDLGDHVWRFERIEGAEGSETASDHPDANHPHFVCTDCGTVACLPGVTVSIQADDGSPRSVSAPQVEVHLRGVCDDCQEG